MANDAAQMELHWKRTRALMFVHIAIWLFFAYIVHWFAPALNKFTLLNFPLGFYMAAQGSLVAFVVQLFIFDAQQSKIDRECGMAED